MAWSVTVTVRGQFVKAVYSQVSDMQIFNRSKLVINHTGYAKLFDSKDRNAAVPTGAYYYIINLRDGCNLSGHVTLIR